jgi:hypothetical protein
MVSSECHCLQLGGIFNTIFEGRKLLLYHGTVCMFSSSFVPISSDLFFTLLVYYLVIGEQQFYRLLMCE